MGMLFTRLYGIIKTLLSKSSRFSKNICFQKELLRSVTSVLSDTGIFLQGVKVLNANLSPIEHFKLMSIVDAIPHEWRQIIRQSTQHLPPHIDDTIYLRLDNSEVALSKFRPNGSTMRLKAKSKSLQLLKKGLKKSFHSFRLTGRKYTPCLLQSLLKLKLENSNIKY